MADDRLMHSGVGLRQMLTAKQEGELLTSVEAAFP